MQLSRSHASAIAASQAVSALHHWVTAEDHLCTNINIALVILRSGARGQEPQNIFEIETDWPVLVSDLRLQFDSSADVVPLCRSSSSGVVSLMR